MDQQYVISLLWLAGYLVSYWMLKVEHEAEKEEYSNGEKVLNAVLPVFSLAMVLFLLIKAWAISVKPYWNKPAAKQKQKAE